MCGRIIADVLLEYQPKRLTKNSCDDRWVTITEGSSGHKFESQLREFPNSAMQTQFSML